MPKLVVGQNKMAHTLHIISEFHQQLFTVKCNLKATPKFLGRLPVRTLISFYRWNSHGSRIVGLTLDDEIVVIDFSSVVR